MADGDELILGELGNAATSTTRLAGDVDGNAVLWIEQQSETNAGEAIVGPPRNILPAPTGLDFPLTILR